MRNYDPRRGMVPHNERQCSLFLWKLDTKVWPRLVQSSEYVLVQEVINPQTVEDITRMMSLVSTHPDMVSTHHLADLNLSEWMLFYMCHVCVEFDLSLEAKRSFTVGERRLDRNFNDGITFAGYLKWAGPRATAMI